MSHSTSYVPGLGSGFVGEGLWAVIDTEPGGELSLEVLAAFEGDGSLEAVVGIILQRGLGHAPDFAILAAGEDQGARIVVRGAARITDAEGTVSKGSGLFHDAVVPASEHFELALGERQTSMSIPSRGGLVPATAVVVRWARMPSPAPVPEPVPEPESEPASEPEAELLPEPVPEPESEPVLIHDVPAAAEGPASSYEMFFSPPAEDVTQAPAPAEELARSPADAEPAGADLDEPADDPPVSPTDPEPDPEPIHPPVPAPTGFIDEIPFEGLPSARPADIPAEVEAPLHWTPPPSIRPPVPDPEPLLTSTPALPAPESVAASEDVGHTVSRAESLRLAQASASTQVVKARRCAQGHLTMAFAPNCRVCRGPVPAQEPFDIPRPALGRLILPGGEVITVDRNIVLGRAPKDVGTSSGEQAHIVRITDPRQEVSSQHAEIVLDHWVVSVNDLGSTNGTEILRPDGRRERLVPRTPVYIETGTRIILAEIIEIQFEATS